MKKIRILFAALAIAGISLFNLNAFNPNGDLGLSIQPNESQAMFFAKDCYSTVVRGGDDEAVWCEDDNGWECIDVLDVFSVNGLTTCAGGIQQ